MSNWLKYSLAGLELVNDPKLKREPKNEDAINSVERKFSPRGCDGVCVAVGRWLIRGKVSGDRAVGIDSRPTLMLLRMIPRARL